MIDRIRDFFRNEHIGITIPIGVVTGLALTELLFWFSAGMLVPILEATALGDDDEFSGFGSRGLDFTIGDITFDYTQVFSYLFVLVVFGFIAWWLFASPAAELASKDSDMRECPECKSSIVADARRCAFCTAQLTPVQAWSDEEQGGIE